MADIVAATLGVLADAIPLMGSGSPKPGPSASLASSAALRPSGSGTPGTPTVEGAAPSGTSPSVSGSALSGASATSVASPTPLASTSAPTPGKSGAAAAVSGAVPDGTAPKATDGTAVGGAPAAGAKAPDAAALGTPAAGDKPRTWIGAAAAAATSVGALGYAAATYTGLISKPVETGPALTPEAIKAQAEAAIEAEKLRQSVTDAHASKIAEGNKKAGEGFSTITKGTGVMVAGALLCVACAPAGLAVIAAGAVWANRGRLARTEGMAQMNDGKTTVKNLTASITASRDGQINAVKADPTSLLNGADRMEAPSTAVGDAATKGAKGEGITAGLGAAAKEGAAALAAGAKAAGTVAGKPAAAERT